MTGTPVYLDYQATTPIDPQVREAMMPFLGELFGNPHSSDHSFGWDAARAINRARASVATLINADDDEIVFTSGATESCNVLPRDDEDAINRYVAMHSGQRESAESRPFPRQVDFWAFSIAAALALNLEPREGPTGRWGKNFIYTSQGIMDNDLCALLAVIAVAKLGHDDPEAREPRRIVELANRLAGAGCPAVLKKLSDPDLRTTPLDRALQLARSLQEQARPVN